MSSVPTLRLPETDEPATLELGAAGRIEYEPGLFGSIQPVRVGPVAALDFATATPQQVEKAFGAQKIDDYLTKTHLIGTIMRRPLRPY